MGAIELNKVGPPHNAIARELIRADKDHAVAKDESVLMNASPVRGPRRLGVFANLGRSNFDGVQDELASYDMT